MSCFHGPPPTFEPIRFDAIRAAGGRWPRPAAGGWRPAAGDSLLTDRCGILSQTRSHQTVLWDSVGPTVSHQTVRWDNVGPTVSHRTAWWDSVGPTLSHRRVWWGIVGPTGGTLSDRRCPTDQLICRRRPPTSSRRPLQCLDLWVRVGSGVRVRGRVGSGRVGAEGRVWVGVWSGLVGRVVWSDVVVWSGSPVRAGGRVGQDGRAGWAGGRGVCGVARI